MKRTLSILLAFVVLAVALPVFAQEGGQEMPKQKMKMYQIVLAKKGPNWKSQNTNEGMDIRMKVVDGVRKMAEAGILVSAGLVNDETDVEFILIFNYETKTEVYNFLQKAELIRNKTYVAESYSYFGPEGLVFQK